MTNKIADFLGDRYDEIDPISFYKDIFEEGLDEWRENPEKHCEYGYTGILLEIGKDRVKRYTVTKELSAIKEAIKKDTFHAMSPISYIGKSRKSENARDLFALVIEIDDIKYKDGEPVGISELIRQFTCRAATLPVPTYLVASGNGIHLYYVFEKPIRLFQKTNPNTVKTLRNYKRYLTRHLWNMHVTRSYRESEIQYESLFQPFRVVGTTTKNGDITRAYKVGNKVTIEYMNEFVFPFDRKKHPENLISAEYAHKYTLEEAKEKFPEWYQSRIIEKRTRRRWAVNSAVYRWWKDRIMYDAREGHRYHCMMCLAIYAVKCGIFDEKKNPVPVTREELEADCLEISKVFSESDTPDNPFTRRDMIAALQAYEDANIFTYPISAIQDRSGIPIIKNKRNYRKMKTHIKYMNLMRDELYPNGEWREGNGRKPKEDIVREWQKNNPFGRKADCIKETGLSKPTVYKWWKM